MRGRTSGQQDGSSSAWTKKQSAISTVWFVRSLDPSVWGWYAVLYSSLTPSFVNKAVQNALRNFGSRSVISSPRRAQSIMSKRLRNACAYCSADQVSIPSIRVMRFENLQVTDISALNPSALTGRARIKSRVKVEKGTGGDLMGCGDP